jgi:hypothetical protein
MSDQPVKSSGNSWLALIVVIILAAFVFFVPVKTATGMYGYSRTTWDVIIGNH